MLTKVIDKYKSVRKNNVLRKASEDAFAFIGVGQHSLSNLYPTINYLGINLKYIYSRSEETAFLAGQKFDCIGTNNLNKILEDKDVKGVFICSAPQTHFELVKQVLKANKSVFVEKPPCFTTEELNELEKLSEGKIIQVGLQKRYAEVYQNISKISKKVSQYQLEFVTGAYPEGDSLMDLFIHPVDLINYLFCDVKTLQKLETPSGSYFLQVEHNNGTIGQLSLSTEGSLANPQESLKVTTPKGTYKSKGLLYLELEKKPAKIGNIPIEKILKATPQVDILVNQNGFVPIAENNSLTVQGYHGEIKAFIDACNGKSSELTTIKDLKETFRILELIRY